MTSAEPRIIESGLGSLTGRYMPVEDSYIRNHFQLPDTSAHSLAIEGGVRNPQQFTLESFTKFLSAKSVPFLTRARNTQSETWDPHRADLYAYNVWHRIRCVVL